MPTLDCLFSVFHMSALFLFFLYKSVHYLHLVSLSLSSILSLPLSSVPGPFQVISHLPLPPIIPLSPEHIPSSLSLSLFLTCTHKHTHLMHVHTQLMINTHTKDENNKRHGLVFFPVNQSRFLSLDPPWRGVRGVEAGSGFVATMPGDGEGSTGSNLVSDPPSSPRRPPH